MKFKLILLLSLTFLLGACAALGDRTVNITEAQLQSKLNERLSVPISLLKIFDVSLSNSTVKFDGKTGRMLTSLDTSVTSLLNKKAFSGKLALSGKLRFDAPTQSVVLDDAKVENLNLDGMGGKYADIFNVMAQKVGGEMLNGLTLYTVKPEDLKLGSTQYHPKDMQITDKGLQITLSPAQ